MKHVLMVCLVVISLSLFADVLPEVKIEAQWLQCKTDSDCAVVRDACRSCGEPIALNKQFIQGYLDVDYRQRKAANMMITCEACSQQTVKVSCEKQICKAVR